MSEPAPTLDLDAFAGHTPGPWASNLVPEVYAVREPGNCPEIASLPWSRMEKQGKHGEVLANAALIAAAPALLAECRRQRHLLDAFAASVQDMLDAWDHPTSASVSMRCSAIAGLRGIMEHWPAGATDPEVTRLNAELTRLRAERTAQGFRTVEEI